MASMDDLFSQYQRARRKNIANKTRQIVGGTAETLRTGESAASTFAKREVDNSGSYMDPMEKVKAKQAILKDLATEEHNYYKQAVEIYKENQRHTRELIKAELDAAEAMMQAQVDAGQTSATLRSRAYGDEIKRKDDELEAMTELSEANRFWVEGATNYLKDQRKALDKEAKNLAAGELDKLAKAAQLDPEGADAQKLKTLRMEARNRNQDVTSYIMENTPTGQWARQWADDQYNKLASDYVTLAKDKLPERGDDPRTVGQLTHAVNALGAAAGFDPTVASQKNAELSNAMALDSKRLLESLDQGQQQLESLVSARYAVGVGVNSAPLLEHMQKASQLRQQMPPDFQLYRQQAEAGQSPPLPQMTQAAMQLGAAPAQGVPGAPGQGSPGEMAMGTDQPASMKYAGKEPALPGTGDDYMLIGGVRAPFTTDTMQRQKQLLDVIDSFPEMPTVQNLKQQIMSHPGYQKYLKENGYQDFPDEAWGQFRRDQAAAARQKKADFRQKKRENILLGKHKGGLGRKALAQLGSDLYQAKHAKGSTVVAGADTSSGQTKDEYDG